MNKEDLKKYEKDSCAALFKITSRCNDSCEFCIEKRFMQKQRDDLSVGEIENNLNYLENSLNLDYIIVTGGEPTLHSDFSKIIEYLYSKSKKFRVITNFLKFKDDAFFKKILPYFSSENKIIGSINDLPINKISIERIEGLKNVLKYKIPLMLIVVVYKNNLKYLSDILYYLDSLFKKYDYNNPVNIELRLIYIEGTMKYLLKRSLPTDFNKIKMSVQKAVDVASCLGITITLWNFPLCYLDRVPELKDETISERRQRRLFKVNKDSQLLGIQVRNFEEYLKKSKVCSDCLYNSCCSGIDYAYIEKYNFPKLKPLKL